MHLRQGRRKPAVRGKSEERAGIGSAGTLCGDAFAGALIK